MKPPDLIPLSPSRSLPPPSEDSEGAGNLLADKLQGQPHSSWWRVNLDNWRQDPS